jgi:exopolyphosphatase/guanosine-5'-triphosphate,3'-diphosphate pyrophosphatase
MGTPTKAVIDIGSNSVLLTVESFDGEKWHSVHENYWVTSLGKNTKSTHLLNEKSITDTLNALRIAFSEARQHGATSITAAATMAARMAKNTSDFLEKADDQGTPVTVLSANDEAAYGFYSVALDPIFANNPYLVVLDPGAQSTEIVVAKNDNSSWNILFQKSYTLGSLGLKGQFLHQEMPNAKARLEAVQECDLVLQSDPLLAKVLRPHNIDRSKIKTVLLGAVGTNLISIREKMRVWEPKKIHGQYLDYEEIARAVDWLASMPIAERSKILGLQPGREETLHIACLLVERCLHQLHVPGCYVTTRGWRHALLELGLNKQLV